ncbi:MAG: hypothetical protein WBA13_01190 [Microcoleaceae cyanobacterium]
MDLKTKVQPLAVNEITNFYLYEDTETPENLVDDSLIRPDPEEPDNATVEKTTVEIDAKDFMETVGRFAIAPQFELVQKFFYDDGVIDAIQEEGTLFPITPDWEEFTVPGTYSKSELAKQKEIDLQSFGWNMQHYN